LIVPKLFIFTLYMLAKSLKYLFTILSAAYFLLVGTGYNVVNYCCQTCANEGIEAVATSSCNAVHHHSHSSHRQQQNSDITCSDVNHNPAGCHLLRLIIDTPFIHTTQKLPVNTILTGNLFYTCVNLLNETPKFTGLNVIHPPNVYFFSSGREIITLHSVFLI